MPDNLQIRAWHRDLGYLFIGLIISFAASGIAQNHRRSWDPEEYVYSSRDIQTQFHTLKKEDFTDELIKKTLADNHIEEKYRRFRVEDDRHQVRIFLEGGSLDVDLKDGKGKLELMKTRPIIGNLSILHKSTNNIWIWYSDVFAIGLIIIAILGTFMVKGKYGYRRQGILLTLAGIVVPLIAIFFLEL